MRFVSLDYNIPFIAMFLSEIFNVPWHPPNKNKSCFWEECRRIGKDINTFPVIEVTGVDNNGRHLRKTEMLPKSCFIFLEIEKRWVKTVRRNGYFFNGNAQ